MRLQTQHIGDIDKQFANAAAKYSARAALKANGGIGGRLPDRET